MSKKGSKADLLVRVRYQNPLPPPPFPPKLLVIPTDPARYATYDFLLPLAAERELPMVVDAELGMPVELGRNDDAYWAGDMSKMCPDPNKKLDLHPDDQALLVEPAGAISAASTGLLNPTPHLTGASAAPAADRKKAEVSWLRRTEYLAADSTPQRSTSDRATPRKTPKRKRTKAERISAINETFSAMHKPLATLKHPTKQGVNALSEHALFHDEVPQRDPYNLMRFSDDPFDKRAPASGEDDEVAQLSSAFLRVVSLEGDALPRIAVYLSKNLETLRELKAKPCAVPDLPMAQPAEYGFLRHFEAHTSRDLKNEFLLAFDDGVPVKFEEGAGEQRQRGAYVTPVGRLQQIRKRAPAYRDENPRDYGTSEEFWNSVNVRYYDRPEVGDQVPDDDLVEMGDPAMEADVTAVEGSTF